LLQDHSVGATINVAVVRGLSEVVPVFHLMMQVHLKVVQLSLMAEILLLLFKRGVGFAFWLLSFDH